MKKFMAAILSLVLAVCLCACGGGSASPSNIDAPANTETPVEPVAENEAAGEPAGTVEEETDDGEIHVILPEDNGMAGVYKWVEMAEYGVDAYLILWDDGVGSIDYVGTGTVRGVLYTDETMQVADEGAVPQNYTYADGKLIWTYTDVDGEHVSTFVKLTVDERTTYEALGVGSVVESGETKEDVTIWPEDNGGIAGVYKWVEMAEYGIEAYLILWDGGIGAIDMAGVEKPIAVFYNDETMQSTDEGAVPQSYTYADGKLVWTYSDGDGEHVSTFVKLTAEELAEYQARGIGNAE